MFAPNQAGGCPFERYRQLGAAPAVPARDLPQVGDGGAGSLGDRLAPGCVAARGGKEFLCVHGRTVALG